MRQPVFFISDPTRKEEFVLETRIWENNGSLVSEKRAANPKATAHLDAMVESYSYLSSLKELNRAIKVVPAIKENEHVNFKFIKGESAERTLLEAVLTGNEESVVTIIDKLISVIKSLPTTKQNSADNPRYVSVFGKTFLGKAPYSKIGLIDLNLDNFIIDKHNDWHLLDYEWVFNFPVSQHFLIQRALWYFTFRHQETFKYHTERLNCIKIAKGVFVPNIVFANYRKYFKNLEEIQKAEQAFQKYVMEFEGIRPGFKFLKEPESVGRGLIGIKKIVSLAEKSKHIPEIEQMNKKLKQEKEILKREKDRLQNENQAILRSRSYRLAKKLASAKRKLKK